MRNNVVMTALLYSPHTREYNWFTYNAWTEPPIGTMVDFGGGRWRVVEYFDDPQDAIDTADERNEEAGVVPTVRPTPHIPAPAANRGKVGHSRTQREEKVELDGGFRPVPYRGNPFADPNIQTFTDYARFPIGKYTLATYFELKAEAARPLAQAHHDMREVGMRAAVEAGKARQERAPTEPIGADATLRKYQEGRAKAGKKHGMKHKPGTAPAAVEVAAQKAAGLVSQGYRTDEACEIVGDAMGIHPSKIRGRANYILAAQSGDIPTPAELARDAARHERWMRKVGKNLSRPDWIDPEEAEYQRIKAEKENVRELVRMINGK